MLLLGLLMSTFTWREAQKSVEKGSYLCDTQHRFPETKRSHGWLCKSKCVCLLTRSFPFQINYFLIYLFSTFFDGFFVPVALLHILVVCVSYHYQLIMLLPWLLLTNATHAKSSLRQILLVDSLFHCQHALSYYICHANA